MKFAFIEQHRHEFPVQQMCNMLVISSTCYYAFRKCGPSARSKEDMRLLVHIRVTHRASHETYGVSRIYYELKAQGIEVSRHRIGHFMCKAGLKVKSRRPYKVTTKRDLRLPVVENLLNRDFESQQPD